MLDNSAHWILSYWIALHLLETKLDFNRIRKIANITIDKNMISGYLHARKIRLVDYFHQFTQILIILLSIDLIDFQYLIVNQKQIVHFNSIYGNRVYYFIQNQTIHQQPLASIVKKTELLLSSPKTSLQIVY